MMDGMKMIGKRMMREQQKSGSDRSSESGCSNECECLNGLCGFRSETVDYIRTYVHRK